MNISDRHPSVQSIHQYLVPNANLESPQYEIAWRFHDLANTLLKGIPDSPEVTAGLRKLLEAKDCFVRASLDTVKASYTDR